MDQFRDDFAEWKRREEGKEPLSGEFLERYVRYMHESLLVTHAQDVNVTHRARVSDIHGDTHEIDVFMEYTFAGIRHRAAIECKDQNRPASRKDAMAFSTTVAEIPNAIGVFVAPRGYQSGAKKYLEDRGVTHYDASNLPHFGAIVGSWFQPLALPDSNAVGQPFWVLMEAANGETTGTHLRIPLGNSPEGEHDANSVIALFISHVDAARFTEALWPGETSVCVRGLERPALRALVSIAGDEGIRFVMMTPAEIDGREQYIQELLSVDTITDRFLATP
ncbi:hypothetical protein EF294_03745 [Gordonia oryzae]|uniref:Restriction endonuclease type IV Mrr domain-containing protein n=1 Tax=Gordonia oryzae TaxID=2487349 RepID=A0A3N4H3E1_9ACTN|nr:hypothetical protein [Gordonia oryzae]RPA65861.1 hypothetical protein EF294_03745 [Gordonia oryzae]